MKIPVPVPDLSPDAAAQYRRDGLWGPPRLAAVLDAHAAEAPTRTAVTDTFGAHLDYGSFARAVRSAATWFRDHGVGYRDTVVLALPNCADYAVAHLALSRLGAASVLLSARESASDIASAVRETSARLVLIAQNPRYAAPVAELAAGGVPVASMVIMPSSTPPATESPSGVARWPGYAALAQPDIADRALEPQDVDGADVELIVFSSGTTGRPKGIAHSYDGAGASLRGWRSALGLTWRDAVFCPATLGHVGGSQWGLRTAVMIGAPLVLMDRWDPAGAARLIGEHRCTYSLVTPTYVVDLMRLPANLRALTAHFRIWAVGGSRMPDSFVRDAEAALGGQVLRGFGMSECFMVTITRPDDPPNRRANRDGRALPGCELDLWDAAGRSLGPDEPGELVVRGPSLTGGYFTDPEETQRTYTLGWQRTGDIATVDRDGFLSVVDRRKEVIIRGGENISPQEVEQYLSADPDLPALLVTAVPDDRLGERAAVVYEGLPGALTLERIRKILANTGLSRYKWPEVVIALDELPRTPLGKIQRGAVKRLIT